MSGKVGVVDVGTVKEEMSMQSFYFLKKAAVVAALLGLVFPFLGQADLPGGNNCKSRPLSDFLDNQGASSTFFPPVPDYVGWAGDFPGDCDPNTFQGTFGLVDYAGLANSYIKNNGGKSLRTKVRGSVRECVLPNGKAEIKVRILTKRALGFAQSINELCDSGFDFADTVTNFGNQVIDTVIDEEVIPGVLNGASAAVGPVIFVTSFTIEKPGDTLPDYLDVAFGNTYAPASLFFASTTFGTRPDGTAAYMQVFQKATVAEGADWDYTIEEVKLFDINGN
jgi:hypothetical protein